MSDRYEEIRCYECGRLKTRLIWKSRCVTCTVQRLESNLEENDTLRDENAALEVRLAEALQAISRNELDAQRAQHVAVVALDAYRKGGDTP